MALFAVVQGDSADHHMPHDASGDGGDQRQVGTVARESPNRLHELHLGFGSECFAYHICDGAVVLGSLRADHRCKAGGHMR